MSRIFLFNILGSTRMIIFIFYHHQNLFTFYFTFSMSSTSFKSISTPREAWEPILHAKKFEVVARKALRSTEYRGWFEAAESIQNTMNEGKEKHQRVMIFNMNDKPGSLSYRERILVFQLGDESEDGTISVHFQGSVYKGEGKQSKMNKRDRCFNRLLSLRRLLKTPKTMKVLKPDSWNVDGYNMIRAAIRKAIFSGLC